jgi:phosphate/sulfate permease
MYTLKRYLKKPLTLTLTLGASLLLGLLSFAGMYILMPLLGVSIAAFVLSVIYEGEIYQRNIENALEKLLDGHYTSELMGEEYLDSLKELPAEEKNALPHFFKTYLKLKAIDSDGNAHPSAARQKRLKLMHIWLGQLIITNTAKTLYAQKVLDSVTDLKTWQEKANNTNRYHRYIQIFSAIAAALMSLGTVYLILEVLPTLPFLSIAPAALTFVVLPMAVIAGIAYGFLSYNSLTDFLLKNNLKEWWQDIKSQLTSPDRNSETIFFAIFSALIFALNLSLTLFTAGTWWSVVNASQTTWSWLKSPIIRLTSTLIAPVVAISTLGFNLENTIETIKEVKGALVQPTSETPAVESLPADIKTSSENGWQLLNPFRILHKLTFTPLEMLLFLGHLVSIGLTADRMPGVPAVISALFGMISEGFEDFHYFFDINKLLNDINKLLNQSSNDGGHAHHHHKHSAIPTKVLEMLFSPLFALSALGHWGFQRKKQSPQKTFGDCYRLQTGKVEECGDNPFANIETKEDDEWIKEETYYMLGEHLNELEQQSFSPDEQAKIAVIDLQEHLSQANIIINQYPTILGPSSSPSTTSLLMKELPPNLKKLSPLHHSKKQQSIDFNSLYCLPSGSPIDEIRRCNLPNCTTKHPV